MPSNTPCLNLNRPDYGATRWDLTLNDNFTILDEAFCQLQTLLFGLSGQSSLRDIIHDVLIQELSAQSSNLRNGREEFVLNAIDISGMKVTLSRTPDITEEYPHLRIEGAPHIIYGVDYVLINDNEISWDPGLSGMDNNDLADCFEVGDEIIIEYNYFDNT
jgi:hypothetical protein